MQGTNTSYVQPGSQFSQQNIQRNAQQRVPFQGQFNGNPRGANNMGRRNNNPFGFQGQGMAPAWSQQNNLGRYRPPTMNGMGGYNSNQWNDMGGMDYNLPGSYGSPLGQGQFAPMPQMFQQYLQQMGQFGGGMGFPGQRGSMNNQFYGGMVNDFFGNQQPRFGGGQTPSYDEWRGGLMTDMMMRSPEEDAAREQGFRDRYNEEFGQQGSGMPPGKDGRPLMEQPQPAPTWDSPFNRSYNIAALRQMMGGG
jgi:hypothetical protein